MRRATYTRTSIEWSPSGSRATASGEFGVVFARKVSPEYVSPARATQESKNTEFVRAPSHRPETLEPDAPCKRIQTDIQYAIIAPDSMPLEVYVDNLRTKKDQSDPTILEFDTRPIVGDFVAIDLGNEDVRTYRVRKVWHHFFRPEDEDFAVSAGLSDGQIIIELEEVHSMTEAPNIYQVPSRDGSQT